MKVLGRTFAKKAKNQKGMTLLEIIIALGIVGVVSAGVVTLAQRAIDSQNMTKATQNLNTIQIAMTQTYRGLGKYPVAATGDGAATVAQSLVGLGRLAAEDVVSPFTGDEVVIDSFAKRDGETAATGLKAFSIAMSGLTLDQCRQLVTNTNEMFPYILAGTDAAATEATGPFQTVAATGAGNGVIKSPAGGPNNLDLTNMTHVENLCGTDDGLTYTVIFGNS